MINSLKTTFNTKSKILITLLFSFSLALSLILPRIVDVSTSSLITSLLIHFIILFPIIILLTILIKWIIEKINLNNIIKYELKNIHFIIMFIILMIIFLINLLVFYPGGLSNDTYDCLKMILNLDFTSNTFRYTYLNNHHPIFYVLYLSIFIKLANIFGLSFINGLFFASLFQIILMSLAIIYFIHTIYQINKSTFLSILIYLFFLLNPLIARLTITIWKDIVYTILVLFFISTFLKKIYLNNKKLDILLLINAIFLVLFRNGGILIPMISFIVYYFIKKEKKYLYYALILLLFNFSLTFVFKIFSIQDSHFSELIATPLQQISRTIIDKGSINNRDEELIERIIPLRLIYSSYLHRSADGIKFNPEFNDAYLETYKIDFIIAWIRTGLVNIKTYIIAWMYETQGFWDLKTNSEYYVPIYNYFDIFTGKEIDMNLIPFLSTNTMNNIFKYYISFTRFISNCSSVFWLICTSIYLSIIYEKRNVLIFSIPLFILGMIYVLDSPVYEQFRYIYPLYISLPAIIFLLFHKENINLNHKN